MVVLNKIININLKNLHFKIFTTKRIKESGNKWEINIAEKIEFRYENEEGVLEENAKFMIIEVF